MSTFCKDIKIIRIVNKVTYFWRLRLKLAYHWPSLTHNSSFLLPLMYKTRITAWSSTIWFSMLLKIIIWATCYRLKAFDKLSRISLSKESNSHQGRMKASGLIMSRWNKLVTLEVLDRFRSLLPRVELQARWDVQRCHSSC